MNARRDSPIVAATAGGRAWAANDQVNVAIVGVGSRGGRRVGDFTRRQDLNLAAVCDLDTGQTERAVRMLQNL